MFDPPVRLSTLQLVPSRTPAQDSRPEWSRFSFAVGLSHPLQCAGFSPALSVPLKMVRFRLTFICHGYPLLFCTIRFLNCR
jgi:hypothetical protein